MEKKKVIAAGHICLDITPMFPDRKAQHPGEILSPGKLLEVGAADVHTGGSVANTGLAMKKLGADVSLMGKVGKDAFGNMILDILKKHDADTDMLIEEGEETSYSVVLAIPGIDRIFLHNAGANRHFKAADIPQEKLEEAALFHFGYPPLMPEMYEDNGAELVSLMKRAKAAGVATSLDMAAVDENAPAGQADWKEILKNVLPFVDFFVPSVEELCFMLDRERFHEWQERADGRDITEILDVEKDIRPLAEQCMEFGAKVLLIKCGVPGMYLRTADKNSLEKTGSKAELSADVWSEKEIFEKSYVPDRVRSGTGAGDSSIAAFLTAMLEGSEPEEALHLAAATGACCVTEYDALSGLKPFDELRAKIAAGWAKCHASPDA